MSGQKSKPPLLRASSILIIFLVIVISVGIFVVAHYSSSSTCTTTTTVSEMNSTDNATVTGNVTLPTGVSYTGYALVFNMTSFSGTGCPRQVLSQQTAALNSTGFYHIILPQGTYNIALSPSCPWASCESVLPRAATFKSHTTYIYYFRLDTSA